MGLAGVDSSRLGPMKQQAARALRSKINDGVTAVLQHATDRQREINRMMVPEIKERMAGGYQRGCAHSPFSVLPTCLPCSNATDSHKRF